MAEHTKGTWQVSNYSDEPFYVFKDEGDGLIICDLPPDNFGNEEQEANAFLIAAAPEMYHALKEILDRHTTTLWCLPSDLRKLIQEAIDKAEGFELEAR